MSTKPSIFDIFRGSAKVAAILVLSAIFSISARAGGDHVAANETPAKESVASESAASVSQTTVSANEKSGALQPVSKSERALLKKVDESYQKAEAITMNVDKTLKLGLLGNERKSKGKLWLSGGRVRMELEGEEKSLLVVNKKSLWAVTFPPPDLKSAAIQVIKGEVSTKKGRSQTPISLLTQGGLLKFFTATGTQSLPGGETLFFLQPKKDQVEFKRAQIRVSKDGNKIEQLRYWDERDNETILEFSDVVFGKKPEEKLFDYTPPADADVMTL